MKTVVHMRMARSALGWSQAELAEASGVGVATIKRMEMNDFENIKSVTIDAVRNAFTEAGVRFASNGCVCPPDEKEIDKSKGRKK